MIDDNYTNDNNHNDNDNESGNCVNANIFWNLYT